MNNNNRNPAYDGPMGIFSDFEDYPQKQERKPKVVRPPIDRTQERRNSRQIDKQKREREFDDDGWN